MAFVHEDREFGDLLSIVADARTVSPGLIEKDYWVTHTLWALQREGFDIWLKGSTSLSKGFGLIQRFSEDLDLKIDPGKTTLPVVENWTGRGVTAVAARKGYFERLALLVRVPGANVSLDVGQSDQWWRGAGLRVTYPGRYLADLGLLRPFVLLEVGSARVSPYVECDMTSFVHDYLDRERLSGEFDDNRPRRVRCVHPWVTVLKKMDALHRRVSREEIEPADFVRHYEDIAAVIAAESRLPAIAQYPDVAALALDMLRQKQIRQLPVSVDVAFVPAETSRWDGIRRAYDAISQMFWGPRVPLDGACHTIRDWIHRWLEAEIRAE